MQEKHNEMKAIFVIFFHISLIFLIGLETLFQKKKIETLFLKFLIVQMKHRKGPHFPVIY